MVKSHLFAASGVFAVVGLLAHACSSRDFDGGAQRGATVQDTPESQQQCDVIIVGGSAAATAAAFAAADGVPGSKYKGAVTCLLEPTNWLGGQLTASGVSAIDFPHHQVYSFDGDLLQDPQTLGTRSINYPPSFAKIFFPGDGGPLEFDQKTCWVSAGGKCFLPKSLLTGALQPEVERLCERDAASKKCTKLLVFYSTVAKRVKTADRRIIQLEAVQRSPKGNSGYENPFSEYVEDWYSEEESALFSKNIVKFVGRDGRKPLVIDASEFGDILALAQADYSIGEEQDKPIAGCKTPRVTATNSKVRGIQESYLNQCYEEDVSQINEKCGQAIVYPFAEKLNNENVSEPTQPISAEQASFFSLNDNPWEKVFRYRRLQGTSNPAASGDITMQNWNPGNDYPFGYLFLGKAATRAQISDWKGGVNLDTLAGAERHALAWHQFFKNNSAGDRISIAKDVLGTKSGLSKMPYLRDTRRSVGIGGYRWMKKDILNARPQTFDGDSESVGIGSYAADFHRTFRVAGCSQAPTHLNDRVLMTYAYNIPFRALTNASYVNLLVAGKTMAQTYYVNGATRLQPTEWASGFAAGSIASFLAFYGLDNLHDQYSNPVSRGDIITYLRETRKQPLQWR